MNTITTERELSQPESETVHLFDDWFDPTEASVRDRGHDFIHAMIEARVPQRLSSQRQNRHCSRCPEVALRC
jgi:hypothetical protein